MLLALAAQASESVSFNDLSSDAPVTEVTGVSASEIQRPTTPRAVSAGVSGALGGGQTLAMEVDPYWLFNHPNLTRDEYLNRRFRSVYRNFAVSAVSVPASGASSGTLGFGARTTLLYVETGPKDRDCLHAIDRSAEVVAGALTEWIMANPQATPAQVKAKQAELEKKQEATLKATTVLDCSNRAVAQHGVVVTGAFAYGADTGTGDGRWAGWITPSFVVNEHTSFMAIAKLTGADTSDEELFSTGLKAAWASDSAALSGEFVARFAEEFGGRVDVSVDYMVKDDVWIQTTFGGDFTETEPLALFTLANLKVNFGEKQADRAGKLDAAAAPATASATPDPATPTAVAPDPGPPGIAPGAAGGPPGIKP